MEGQGEEEVDKEKCERKQHVAAGDCRRGDSKAQHSITH
jgi:hypothetical protein